MIIDMKIAEKNHLKKDYDSLTCSCPELGTPLPENDPHACSVSMPKWDHVVKYEQGCPIIHGTLACGYPRFVFQPSVRKLNEVCHGYIKAIKSKSMEEKDNFYTRILPSVASAERCVEFLNKLCFAQENTNLNNSNGIKMYRIPGCEATILSLPEKYLPGFNIYWQHTGELVSSRYADRLLSYISDECPQTLLQIQNTATHKSLCNRIADLTQQPVENVFVYPCGMTGIFSAKRLMNTIYPEKNSVVFGFPYLDTLKMMKRKEWGKGCHFFPSCNEENFLDLEEILKQEKIAGIFAEFPGNPIPRSADIHRLVNLAHQFETFVIIDDTIGSFNLDILGKSQVDIVVTSLTKIFSGSCNVMGGSMIINNSGHSCLSLLKKAQETTPSYLFEEDASILFQASMDLECRLSRVNKTTGVLVERLRVHPLIRNVYYPKYIDTLQYDSFLKDLPNTECSPVDRYGPVFSIVLNGHTEESQEFYDHLCFAKGPSLGTNFTLCCPYTLLAHYYELDYVESCGIDRNLIRVSVGLESVDMIWECFEKGFAAVNRLKQKE